mgnify:CR=1 FL=1
MYIVNGIEKVWEEDDYVNGCIGKQHYTEIDVSFKAADLKSLLDKLQGFTGCDGVLLNSCEEQGRVDLQRHETVNGVAASESDMQLWRDGKKKLYAVTYTAIVYKAEVSALVEGF